MTLDVPVDKLIAFVTMVIASIFIDIWTVFCQDFNGFGTSAMRCGSRIHVRGAVRKTLWWSHIIRKLREAVSSQKEDILFWWEAIQHCIKQ